jgi:hypothetical protein
MLGKHIAHKKRNFPMHFLNIGSKSNIGQDRSDLIALEIDKGFLTF